MTQPTPSWDGKLNIPSSFGSFSMPSMGFAGISGVGGGTVDVGLGSPVYTPQSGQAPAPAPAPTPAPAPAYDMSKAGAGEQFWQDYGKQFMGGPNYAEQGFTALQSATANRQAPPELAQNLEPFYQQAEGRAAQALNRQAAARGSYGSSSAVGQLGSMYGQMEADRARAEGQYGLQRSADMRAWDQSGLGWASALAGAGAGADASGSNRFRTGLAGSMGAQQLGQSRWQDIFNAQLGMGNAVSGTIGSSGQGMISTDAGLLGDAINAWLGSSATGTEAARYKKEAGGADIASGLSTAGGVGSLMKMIPGLGG